MLKSSFIAACAVLSTVAGLHAHDAHSSTAEAEFNPKTQRLEVSLTVFLDDLELALMRQSERMMSIERTPTVELDAEICRYLGHHFICKTSEGAAGNIEWVGREMEDPASSNGDATVVLFFQIPLTGGPDKLMLENSVLCDLFKDQTNLLLVKWGAQKEQLKFTAAAAIKPLIPRRL